VQSREMKQGKFDLDISKTKEECQNIMLNEDLSSASSVVDMRQGSE
jgi:hypothetical protein